MANQKHYFLYALLWVYDYKNLTNNSKHPNICGTFPANFILCSGAWRVNKPLFHSVRPKQASQPVSQGMLQLAKKWEDDQAITTLLLLFMQGILCDRRNIVYRKMKY